MLLAETSSVHSAGADFFDARSVLSYRRRLAIVFNNNIKVEGAWDLELAKLGKLHYTVDEDGTRIPMTQAYEKAREKRIQRQVLNRWRRYHRKPEETGDAHPEDVALIESNKNESKCECMLPWWCIILPWLMVVLPTVTCAFFTIVYTFNFGVDKSLEWVRSLITSLFSDIFFNQPLTILFVACFFTFIIKRSEMEKLELDVDAEDELDESDEALKYRLETEKQAISMLKLDDIYRPPPTVLHI